MRLFSGGFICVVWIDLPYVKRVGKPKERGGNMLISRMLLKLHPYRGNDEGSCVGIHWSKEWKEMQLQFQIIMTQSNS